MPREAPAQPRILSKVVRRIMPISLTTPGLLARLCAFPYDTEHPACAPASVTANRPHLRGDLRHQPRDVRQSPAAQVGQMVINCPYQPLGELDLDSTRME